MKTKISVLSVLSLKLSLLISVILWGSNCIAQKTEISNPEWKLRNDELLLDAKVELIDSLYLLIPTLTVLTPGEKIQIRQSRWYDNEKNEIADCRVAIQKLQNSVYVNLYVDALKQFPFDFTQSKFIDFKHNDRLKDTISLAYFIPIQTGEYRVLLEFDFYRNEVKHTITSRWVDFNVSFIPRDSL